MSTVLPADFLKQIEHLQIFIAEELRTARRFLRKAGYQKNFDDVIFYELNEHTPAHKMAEFLSKINEGDIGLLSEAGSPCVADPGSAIVRLAHQRGIPVVPMVGPSSILLALTASGLNGQSFAFHGYLPVDASARKKRIKDLEVSAIKYHQTQMFIETPYRNNHLLTAICEVCQPNTLVCVACNITQEDEFIVTRPVSAWKQNLPDLHKKNTVFLIGK